MQRQFLYILIFFGIVASCCSDDDMPPNGPSGPCSDYTIQGTFGPPTAATIEVPFGFQLMPVPDDNPLTEEGILLGRKLFFDPILSRDSTMSCGSCHLPNSSFTDQLAVSTGIDGIAGTRSSMSLLDVAYNTTGLFWDGRSATLEEQALLPVEDEIELHHTWPEVICKLKDHNSYPAEFAAAFGINSTVDITKEIVAKAISQFERSIVSSGNSKFDRIFGGDISIEFTADEYAGYSMFFDVDPLLPDAECGHCHGIPYFTTFEFRNNGIDSAYVYTDFPDPGKGALTNVESDYGKFKTPTLRNIEYTAPYMHDGRFNTLEEVIDHYNSGGHYSEHKDPLIVPLGLSDTHKGQILAFLKMLSDTSALNNPAYSNPFE